DRGHRDDPLDVPLLDQVVAFRGDPSVGQEGVELREGGLPVVDVEVRVVTAVDGRAQAHVPGELYLVRLHRNLPIRVVEEQADLAGGKSALAGAAPTIPSISFWCPTRVRRGRATRSWL